jgi:DNA gyrase subunit B
VKLPKEEQCKRSIQTIPFLLRLLEFSYDTLSARMRELSYLNKGITITFTDKREKDKDGNFISEVFHSDEGLKEYIRYLDGNREPIISHVISMDSEKGEIPVEVALIYNTVIQKIFFLM